MPVLSGADLVLPDRIVAAGTLRIDNGRIVRVESDAQPNASSSDFSGHTIVPGFVDVHVHGVGGVDTLDGGDAVARMASRMPAYGVTAFCPTTVACAPSALTSLLRQVRACRAAPLASGARVLPAHLESNFINPEYSGAQPSACLRTRVALTSVSWAASVPFHDEAFTAQDILRVIEQHADAVAIVTMAPEIEGGLDLVSWLTGLGIRVSIGHSGATYDEALAAIAAGARQATHLFNRMPPLHHRRPGLVGAVLESPSVVAELICDGVHVHPALVRVAVRSKTVDGVMAVTDGASVSGLASGTRGMLGGQPVVHDGTCARLTDGTLAGSVLTMDETYRRLTGPLGFSPADAVRLCSTTPARALGLEGYGVIAEGAVADLVVLDRNGQVAQTYVDGRLVHARPPAGDSGLRVPV